MPIDNGPDPDARRRADALRVLGLYDTIDEQFDAIATEVAQKVAVIAHIEYIPSAMVNWRTLEGQFFAGLHVATGGLSTATRQDIPRHLSLEDGWCPKVVRRKLAYPLGDVRDSGRWVGNPVVNTLGIRSYLGAPIFAPGDDDLVLGSVCVVDTEERQWGSEGRKAIKDTAMEIRAYVARRSAAPTRPR